MSSSALASSEASSDAVASPETNPPAAASSKHDADAPGLDALPDDVLVDLMRKLDGFSLARLSSCSQSARSAAATLPPLMFAANGKLVVFRSRPSVSPEKRPR